MLLHLRSKLYPHEQPGATEMLQKILGESRGQGKCDTP